MDKQILMSFADIPEETVERFRETFQQSKQLMTYYSCALLEVETKFRVLNQQFSLEQEHNPIETIKTAEVHGEHHGQALSKKAAL